MPPIDPSLIPQQPQGRTLAGPIEPYYTPQPQPFTGARPFSLPPRQQQLEHKETAMMPSQIRSAEANATNSETEIELKKLQLRKERAAQGLDPDTGQPSKTSGLLGDDALQGLNPGEVATVKAITQGRFPVSSFSTRSPETMKLVERAMQYEPGTDLTTFQRRSVAFQKFMSNPNSPMLRVNQALQHLGRFAENAKTLGNMHQGVMNPFNLGNYAKAGYGALNKTPEYEAFATDRDALAAELAAAFQGGGTGGALTDREEWKKRLSAANSPESFDEIIKEAVGLLGGRVEASNAQFKQAVGSNAEFYDLMSPEAKKVYQRFSDNAPAEDTTGEKVISTETKSVPIPEGYQSQHAAYLSKHPPGTLTYDDYRELRQKLDEHFSKELGGTRSHLDNEEVKKFVDDYNKYHGKVNKIPDMNVPLGTLKDFSLTDPNAKPLEKFEAGFGDTDTGVALANMGNAGSMGLVDLATGQEGREARDLANAAHPGAAIVGELAGSVGGMTALEKLGAKGLKLVGGKVVKMSAKEVEEATARTLARDAEATARQKLVKDAGVNAAYGAGRGFNGADDGEGGAGAVKGLAEGVAATGAGNLVTKGVTPLLSDKAINAIEQLKGVKLTTLQKLGLGKVEAAATSVPLAHGARSAAIKSFVRNDANRALSYIGQKVPKNVEPGTEMNAYVDQQLGNAYNEIRPKIVGSTDKQFLNGITALKGLATRSKDERNMQAELDKAVEMFTDENGHYTGQGYKEASAELRSLQKTWAADTDGQAGVFAQRYARKAEQVRKQMQFLIQRQTPEVGARLKQLERGWAHKMRIEDASNRAMTADETAVYSPNQKLAAIKKFDNSVNKGATARGKAFDQQYAEAGAKVMGGGNVPKVSLRDTGYALAGLGATGYAAPATMPFFATAVAGAYGPGIKQTVQLLLTGKRPKAVDNMIVRRALEDYVRHNATGD